MRPALPRAGPVLDPMAAAFLAVLFFGILTLWVPAQWPVAAVQVALFVLVLLCSGASRVRWHWVLVPALLLPATGLAQLAARRSEYAFATEEAAVAWFSAACALWLGLQLAGRDWLRRALVWFSFLAAVLAILQLYTSGGRVFWLFPSGAGSEPYVMGPFPYRNHYAAWIILMLPAALYESFGRRASLLQLSMAAVMYASVVASASRAGTILASAAVLGTGLLAWRRGLLPGREIGIRAAKMVLLLAAFTAVAGWQSVLGRLSEADPFAIRRELAQSTAAMIAERPLTGAGLGAWPVVYPAYALVDTGRFANRAHSDWLEWMADGGAPFALAMLALAGAAAVYGVRTVWGLGLAVVFLHALVDYPFSRPPLAVWHFALLGLMAGSLCGAGSGGARRLARFARVAVAALACVAAGLWALRFAYADHFARGEDPRRVAQAVQVMPGNAAYHLRLAGLLDAAGDAAGARRAWEGALRLNPRESKAWIGLGLQLEAEGDLAAAESHLLKAARADRQFLPAWSLAGFYLRRQREAEFWRWAREAARMAPGDGTPVFRLLWRAAGDPREIFERGLPHEPALVRRYLAFLVTEGRAEGIAEPALWLAGQGARDDAPLLLNVCDVLLWKGRVEAALRLWSELSERRLIALAPPRPGEGLIVSNGGFAADPVTRGFDWRLHPPEGVSLSLGEGAPRSLRVSFSGRQPEVCEPLSQVLAVQGGQRYRIRFRYRAEGIRSPGLRWVVLEMPSGRDLTETSPELTGVAVETVGEIAFRAPQDARAVRLVLLCRRVPGATRVEGAVWLTAFESFSGP